jgi:plastocyanin
MKVTTFGLDLAKRVFQLHRVDIETGEICRRQMKLKELLEFFGNRAPAVIAMEACGSAHYWRRKLVALRSEVKLIAAQFPTVLLMRRFLHHVQRRVVVLTVALATSLAIAQPAAPLPPVTAEVGPDGVQRASITLDSYSFTPARLIVQAGRSVELTLTSVTTLTPHNFILKEAAAGLSVAQEVGPHETAKVIFTPTKPGIYVFYCDKKLPFFPSHREQGMEGQLEVRP